MQSQLRGLTALCPTCYPGRVAGGLRKEKSSDERERLPWGRRDDEGPAAFARFLLYRDMPPTERSLAKVAQHAAISKQLVERWSSRFAWMRRALAYDRWLLELGDSLGKHAALHYRARAASLGSALLDKAQQSVRHLKEQKQTAQDVATLARAGVQLADVAFGPQNTQQTNQPINIGVGVNFASGSEPSWSQTKAVLVQPREKVLERNQAAPPQMLEDKVAPPLPRRQSLREAMIKAPVRREE